MNILAFDTCFGACSAAVGLNMGCSDQRVFSRCEPMEQGHVQRLLPMIADVVGAAGIPLVGFDLIGVTVGPGTFAGTRIGVAAAKGLGLATGVRLTGVSALALIAAEAGPNNPKPYDICVTVDARRAELYTQAFDPTGTIARSAPALLTIKQACDLSENRGITYVGTGANLVHAARGNATHATLCILPEPTFSDARFALGLLLQFQRSYKHHAPHAITPLYLRAPDAKSPAPNLLQRH